ncbi:MAG: glycosyltransferase family 39 protein [Solirubrobacteraceae bacterium]
MATSVSRPGWELRARSLATARIAVPVGLALLVYLSLRLRTAELNVGYWVDEGLSVGIADRPLTGIPGILRQDGSPPLYYCLLHVWMSLTDSGERSTHTLSLLFALAAVPAAFWGAGLVFSRRAAWIAAVLTALNPFLSQYAEETRMYSLVVLLCMLATSLFLRAYTGHERPARRWPLLFGLALAATLYTHNWAIFLGLAMGLAWLGLLFLAPAPERRARLRDGVLGFGLTALLYLPWLPTLLFQAAHTGAPWSRKPTYEALTIDATHRLLGHTAWLVLVVGAGGGVVALVRAGRGLRLTAEGRAVLAVGVVGIATLLLAFAASQISPAWAMRYLAIAVPPFLLLCAAGLAAARGTGLLTLAIVAILWGYDVWPITKSNVRQVAAAIAPSLSPGDVVVSTQPEQVPVLHHYLPPGLRYATLTGFVGDAGVTDWRDGVERLRASSAQRDLQPILDGLQPGRRIVMVTPIIFDETRWRAPWTQLVRVRSEEFSQYVSNDPRFSTTSVFPAAPTQRLPNPVTATVLVKTRR